MAKKILEEFVLEGMAPVSEKRLGRMKKSLGKTLEKELVKKNSGVPIETPAEEKPTAKSAAEVIMEKAAKKREGASAASKKTEEELKAYEKERRDFEKSGKEAIAQSMAEKRAREEKEKAAKAENLARELARKGWEEAEAKDRAKATPERLLTPIGEQKAYIPSGEPVAGKSFFQKVLDKTTQYAQKTLGWLRSL